MSKYICFSYVHLVGCMQITRNVNMLRLLYVFQIPISVLQAVNQLLGKSSNAATSTV